MEGKLVTNNSQVRIPPNSQDDYSSASTTRTKGSESIFGSFDKNLVLFAYNKHQNEQSPQQIMVLQQPKKKIKCQNEEDSVKKMLANICFEPRTEQKFFLKKVDPSERKQISEEIKSMLSISNQLSMQDRFQRRKEIFEASKARKGFQQASEEVIAKRSIRVVKLDSLMQGGSVRGVVQLGGQSIEYQDLSLEGNSNQYYTLVKKTVRSDQIYPQIQIERDQLFGEISYEPDQIQKEYDLYGDQYDSNDSDNPNYDYPDEEESQRSSEGIIQRDYDEDQEMCQEYEEDQEQLYQKYLRRLRKKEREMQIEHEYQDFD